MHGLIPSPGEEQHPLQPETLSQSFGWRVGWGARLSFAVLPRVFFFFFPLLASISSINECMGMYIGLYRPTHCCWFGLRQRCLLVLSVWISSSFDKWKT